MLRYAGDANTPDPATVPVELSTDAGATWKPVAHNGTPIAGIPAGGVLTPYTSPDGMLVFDPAQGNLRPLANGPRLSAVAGGLVVNGRGPTSTVWWGGGGTDGRASVAVSHDGGATWLQRELPGLAYGSTPRPYVFGLASRDGTTAYAFAYDNHASVRTPDPAIAGTEGFGWVRVFRTTDGGNTWQDLDPAAVMPSYAHVWMTADGRLVLALLNPRMDGAPTPSAEPSAVAGAAEFAVSDDGRTFRVAAPAGLPGALFDVDGSVAYSDRAMYVSDDGWTWREVWHE